MKTTKKKPFWPMIGLGGFFAIYLGYLVGGAWVPGRRFDEFMAVFSYVLEHPFANYFNVNTPRCVVAVTFVYAIAITMYYTSQRNMMPGREFGTAKFANIKQVVKNLQDPNIGYNRILSQNVRMSLDTRRTKLNNNVLIIGGSGAGKTFYEVKPNLMQMPDKCSFICTDPKGELLRSCGGMLKKNGYNVKVINLLEMDKSDRYNPFAYIRQETDVVKLITNLIANTTPKGSNPSDPFWQQAEGLLLQSLFYYVWMEMRPEERNFKSVLKLLGEAKVSDKGEPSRLDVRMKYLSDTSPLGENHPAVKQYNKCMRGAGDTVRSIIISANSRLAFLENQQVLDMLSKDELNLAELGIGVNGDGRTKTALFCVIPDNDKSYNFIIGMLYTQIFQELYYQADFNCGGRLPIHVTFMLDEFANVALPDDYCSLLSTMRSREISSVIIIQNLAQIKALFKDTWETIPGNCDTLIYLGGNEQSTHKYISELLGKATIDKRTNGETRGRQGSSSRNYDVLGRELLTPDEARKFENEKCLIFIRGYDPIMDNKYKPMGHPAFSQTADGGAMPYVHTRGSGISETKEYEILTPESLKYYEKLAEKGENVFIDSLTMDEVTILSEVGVHRKLMDNDEKIAREKMYEDVEASLEYVDPTAEEEIIVDMDKIMKEDVVADRREEVVSDEPEEITTATSENINRRRRKNRLNKKSQQLKYPSESFSDESRYNADRFENDYMSNKINMESSVTGTTDGSSGGMSKVIHKNVGPEAALIGGKKSDDDMHVSNTELERQKRIEEYKGMRTGEELPEIQGNDSLINRIGQWSYSKEQKVEMHKAFEAGMSSDLLLEFFYPDMPVVAMRKIIAGFKEGGGKTIRNIQ